MSEAVNTDIQHHFPGDSMDWMNPFLGTAGLFFAGGFLYMVWSMYLDGSYLQAERPGRIYLGLLLTPFFIVFLPFAVWKSYFTKTADADYILTVGPEGVWDCRQTSRMVGWDRIDRLDFNASSEGSVCTLVYLNSDGSDVLMNVPPKWIFRLAFWLGMMAERSKFPITTWGIQASSERIQTVISAFLATPQAQHVLLTRSSKSQLEATQ